MQNILNEVTRLIEESQKHLESELARKTDRTEYWAGRIDGLFAVKTLLQMGPADSRDDDPEPDYIDLSDAIEYSDRLLLESQKTSVAVNSMFDELVQIRAAYA